jgi:predicted nucleic acid-binding protein
MKPKVYIETSVVSYLTSRLSRNDVIRGHQAATHKFWTKLDSIEGFVSDLVLKEASSGDPDSAKRRIAAVANLRILNMTAAAAGVAQHLIAKKAIPASQFADAAHIAIAALNGMDLIVTWNFSHLNNPQTRSVIRKVLADMGYIAPELCSPDELLGDEA